MTALRNGLLVRMVYLFIGLSSALAGCSRNAKNVDLKPITCPAGKKASTDGKSCVDAGSGGGTPAGGTDAGLPSGGDLGYGDPAAGAGAGSDTDADTETNSDTGTSGLGQDPVTGDKALDPKDDKPKTPPAGGDRSGDASPTPAVTPAGATPPTTPPTPPSPGTTPPAAGDNNPKDPKSPSPAADFGKDNRRKRLEGGSNGPKLSLRFAKDTKSFQVRFADATGVSDPALSVISDFKVYERSATEKLKDAEIKLADNLPTVQLEFFFEKDSKKKLCFAEFSALKPDVASSEVESRCR